MSRLRSYWGWGYEDKFPRDDVRKAVASTARRRVREDSRAAALRRRSRPLACPSRATRRRSSSAGSARPIATRARSTPTAAVIAISFVASPATSRRRPTGSSIRPRSSTSTALFRFCEKESIAFIPYGGGTSVVGGNRVSARTVASVAPPRVDLTRMDKVLEVDMTSRAARIQGGASGPRISDQLNPHGLSLRHFPQSFELSTLGGWIATRAGGHYATLYTHIDDFVESVRMVTPAGVIETRRLPGVGRGPEPGALRARLRGRVRHHHRGVGARAVAASLARVGERALRTLRGRRDRRAHPLAVGALPLELPPARPGRGDAPRGGDRRHERPAHRVRVRRPSRRAVDGARALDRDRPRRRRRRAEVHDRRRQLDARRARRRSRRRRRRRRRAGRRRSTTTRTTPRAGSRRSSTRLTSRPRSSRSASSATRSRPRARGTASPRSTRR